MLKTAPGKGYVAVAQHDVENAALSVVGGQDDGMIFSASSGIGVGIGAGQDGEALGRTAHVEVDFVLRVQPGTGKSLGDGMVLVANIDHGRLLFAVGSAFARAVVQNHLVIFPEDLGAMPLGGSAVPSTYPDHPLVFFPLGEGVVCGMDDDKAPSILQVFHKIELHFLRPKHAVVIGQDHVMGTEIRSPFLPFRLDGRGHFRNLWLGCAEILLAAVIGGSARKGHFKLAGFLQGSLHELRGFRPVPVVVLAFDEQDLEWFGRFRSSGSDG